MSELAEKLGVGDARARTTIIVDTLVEAFEGLMAADPGAFRAKFRKMAADPFAFYRGSDCLFYTDVAGLPDRWADERTSRAWIQGDLHAENFGTYMDGDGALIFDVNDFDEAYLGHFTWDVYRLVASVALLGWRKALSDADIDALVRRYGKAYLDQVRQFVRTDRDHEFSLRLDNTQGAVYESLQRARLTSRAAMLDSMTEMEGFERVFRAGPGVRRLDDDERTGVLEAYERYLETIPEGKRLRGVAYTVKDVVGRSGFGIGSAGLPAYTVLIEGQNQALDNDVVLSMKQGNVAAASRAVTDERITAAFDHHGHRTAVSQRALQAHSDRLLGYTELDGVGFVVRELSPYEADLDWSELSEPDEMAPVLEYLGRATAKAHCVSDADSDTSLVDFQTEEAIAEVVGERDEEFVGVLVVSRNAGVADELAPAAVRTDPTSPEDLISKLELALALSPEERRQRLATLADLMQRHQPRDWAAQVVAAIRQPSPQSDLMTGAPQSSHAAARPGGRPARRRRSRPPGPDTPSVRG